MSEPECVKGGERAALACWLVNHSLDSCHQPWENIHQAGTVLQSLRAWAKEAAMPSLLPVFPVGKHSKTREQKPGSPVLHCALKQNLITVNHYVLVALGFLPLRLWIVIWYEQDALTLTTHSRGTFGLRHCRTTKDNLNLLKNTQTTTTKTVIKIAGWEHRLPPLLSQSIKIPGEGLRWGLWAPMHRHP